VPRVTDPDRIDAAETRATVGAARVGHRDYFSTQHLHAGWFAATAAGEREWALTTREPTFDMKHRTLVINAIVESAAFIEAAINEVFVDTVDQHPAYISSLDDRHRAVMSTLRSGTTTARGCGLSISTISFFRSVATPRSSTARLHIKTRST
jgi:hypothetical protein